MYAQHSRRNEATPAAVPRNYSGNAFRYPPPTVVTPGVREGETAREEDTRERLPMAAEPEHEDIAAEPSSIEGMEDKAEKEERREETPAVVPEERLRLPALFPHGIGSEELLLLGLILLLSGKEGDGERGDLPLYLLLLLFCG